MQGYGSEDMLLNSEDEFPSTQIQRPMDKPIERQDKQPPKPPRSPPTKCRHETPRGSYEDPPKKRPCRFQQENAENVKEKIRKSEESIS